VPLLVHADVDFETDISAIVAALNVADPSSQLAHPSAPASDGIELGVQLHVANAQASHYKAELKATVERCTELERQVEALKESLSAAEMLRADDDGDALVCGLGVVEAQQLLEVCSLLLVP
jgi:hypothetical protein